MRTTSIGYELIHYDASRHDFVQLVRDLFQVEDLGAIHEEHTEQFKVGDDSKTSFHKRFYDRYRAGWPAMEAAYQRLVAEVVAPTISGDFLMQKFPTFRVHLRGNVAVGAFHTDAEFGHPAGEINFIIPLTNSSGTASPWVESEPGKGDYEPMILAVGHLVRFNGNRLSHGNKMNTTDRARLSMDFRILPMSCYQQTEAVSKTRGTKFVAGEYYKRFMR